MAIASVGVRRRCWSRTAAECTQRSSETATSCAGPAARANQERKAVSSPRKMAFCSQVPSDSTVPYWSALPLSRPEGAHPLVPAGQQRTAAFAAFEATPAGEDQRQQLGPNLRAIPRRQHIHRIATRRSPPDRDSRLRKRRPSGGIGRQRAAPAPPAGRSVPPPGARAHRPRWTVARSTPPRVRAPAPARRTRAASAARERRIRAGSADRAGRTSGFMMRPRPGSRVLRVCAPLPPPAGASPRP